MGCNLFAYCLNNPVQHIDPFGNLAIVDDLIIVCGIAIVALIAINILIPPPSVAKTVTQGWTKLTSSLFQGQEKTSITSAVKEKSQSLPTEGAPDSDEKLKNKDGSTKQIRHFNSKGAPDFDIDYNHTNSNNSHEFPHVHIWVNDSRISTPIDYWQFFYMMIEFI